MRMDVFSRPTDQYLNAEPSAMELSFVARAFRALVGVALFALYLVNDAEDRLSQALSFPPVVPTSSAAAETVALSSRLSALAELAQPLIAFAFAITTIGVALVIAAGARRQGSVSLVFLGAALPALLYQIASKFMG